MYSSSPPPPLHEPGHLIFPQGRQAPRYRIVRLLGALKKEETQGYLTGREDTLHIVLEPNIFEMNYLEQSNCTYSIRGDANELIVSMEIYDRANPQKTKFTCVFIEVSTVQRLFT